MYGLDWLPLKLKQVVWFRGSSHCQTFMPWVQPRRRSPHALLKEERCGCPVLSSGTPLSDRRTPRDTALPLPHSSAPRFLSSETRVLLRPGATRHQACLDDALSLTVSVKAVLWGAGSSTAWSLWGPSNVRCYSVTCNFFGDQFGKIKSFQGKPVLPLPWCSDYVIRKAHGNSLVLIWNYQHFFFFFGHILRLARQHFGTSPFT